jgi:assimilatory nitrate reductase catalytic subunit
MSTDSIRTTCPYCGVGCGVLVSREAGGWQVRGDPLHPANRGRLCSKGAALGETLALDERLLHPQVDGRRVDWDTALDTVARRFSATLAEHGPEAVAFYVSGQLLTEDYYLANKLMKGYLGSANIDTNSRLCMASAVSGHKRAFGSDAVPGCYEDIELADLVVLVGSNAAWTHPVLHQRLTAARQARPQTRVVVIDPRRTATAELADLHLPLAPGTDAWLFNGLLEHLRREGGLDWGYLEAHVEGFGEALAAVEGLTPSAVAAACALPEADVATFFGWFARTQRTVTLFSQGINQSSSGVDKVNAILNVHLATGRVGRPGASPLSLTGQPNAMGGREVGALANQLAAHMDFAPAHVERVRRFWRAPHMATGPGLKAVELFQAVRDGRIKALWIMATNPLVSLPEADAVAEALARCPFVVVSDVTRHTDTARHAHVLLPAAAWGEKDGTVTNSERRISRQRAFLPLPGEARPDWWIVSAVARRMGFGAGFEYRAPAEIFREHAALSAFENAGTRPFDLGPLAKLDAAAYDRLEPIQWPLASPGAGKARLFADGRYPTPTARARMVPIRPRPPARSPSVDRPLLLNTGRIRDQWHTMTRTGLSARLFAHIDEPRVEVHPRDMRRWGLTPGGLARVCNGRGEVLVRVSESAGQRPGSVFVPMHWNAQYTARGRIGALVEAVTDPISGQPEFKHVPVAVAHYAADWQGFVLARRAPEGIATPYWCRIRAPACWRYELAGEPAHWPTEALLARWLGEGQELIELRDPAAGRYRAALLRDGRLQAVVFLDRQADMLPARQWLTSLFERERLSDAERACLLLGRPAQAAADAGRTVCVCHGVGERTLAAAIAGGADSVEALGQVLKAGTGCGACVPELRALLGKTRPTGRLTAAVPADLGCQP